MRDIQKPGRAGIKLALYRPVLVVVDRLDLRVQAVEPITTYNHRTAAVVQEWAIRLFGVGAPRNCVQPERAGRAVDTSALHVWRHALALLPLKPRNAY